MAPFLGPFLMFLRGVYLCIECVFIDFFVPRLYLINGNPDKADSLKNGATGMIWNGILKREFR
jgi:hypothetical protein